VKYDVVSVVLRSVLWNGMLCSAVALCQPYKATSCLHYPTLKLNAAVSSKMFCTIQYINQQMPNAPNNIQNYKLHYMISIIFLLHAAFLLWAIP